MNITALTAKRTVAKLQRLYRERKALWDESNRIDNLIIDFERYDLEDESWKIFQKYIKKSTELETYLMKVCSIDRMIARKMMHTEKFTALMESKVVD